MNTQRLRESFKHDGYVVMRSFLNTEELSELEQKLNQLITDKIPLLPKEQVFYEDKDRPETLKQIQKLFEHDDYFANLFLGSKFEALAATLLNAPAIGKNMQYFNKPPMLGQATPPHQDGYYFMLTPSDAVTLWLALDEVDEENGCVRYVRGSNQCGLRPHRRTQTLGFSQGIADYGHTHDIENEIAMTAKPGDLLAHHALTIHRADGNSSASRPRRALGFIYYSAHAREDKTAHEAYQKQLAAELLQQGKI